MGKKRRIFQRNGQTVGTPSSILKLIYATHPELHEEEGIRRLSRAMTRLHEGLTRDRSNTVGALYLDDPELRFAYQTYMLATQSPKLIAVIDRLSWASSSTGQPYRVLDLGCGVGTGTLALSASATFAGRPIEFVGVDHSREALKTAEKFAARVLQSEHRFEAVHASLKQLSNADLPKMDLCLAMNVLNEVPESEYPSHILTITKYLKPDGRLILIEPSTQESARSAQRFRDELVRIGWCVERPCPTSDPCPMLQHPRDWCHDVWSFERPEFVRRVDELTALRREELKATWFVLKPPGHSNQTSPLLVVGERVEEKGRSCITVCDGERLRTLELQKRDVSDANCAFLDVGRYDRVKVTEVNSSGSRERLSSSSKFQRWSMDTKP